MLKSPDLIFPNRAFGVNESSVIARKQVVSQPAFAGSPGSALLPTGVPKGYVLPGLRFGGQTETHPSVKAFEQQLNANRAEAGKPSIRLTQQQRQAMTALAKGQGVVADLPTGAGKTMIAEYAIEQALANKQKIYYTTPRKALSNEKYQDFVKQYGAENVGLKTGDVTVNGDAPIVIMTTEVYRNMLYEAQGERQTPDLDNLKYVVFDECHFINDPDRGGVWEESAIYSPPGVQQIHLSATIQNADQYTAWLNSLQPAQKAGRPNFERVWSRTRPVPLDYEYLSPRGRLVSILKANTEAQSREFISEFERVEGAASTRGNRAKGRAAHAKMPPSTTFNPVRVTEVLQQQGRLPAINFVFSRTKCEQYAQIVSKSPLKLLSDEERQKVNAFIENYARYYPEVQDSPLIAGLRKGVAYHHSGCLPYEKSLVELLLKRGLVKAVFATETLGAGMNVPARTVVMTSTVKRGDLDLEGVKDSDFQQMVGRAGRQGMDERGYAVLCHPDRNDPEAPEGNRALRLVDLALAPPNRIESQLKISPEMAVNLLERLPSASKVKQLLDKSFMAYQRTDRLGGASSVRREFNQMQGFLKSQGFLSQSFKPTPRGQLAAELATRQSLLLATMIEQGAFEKLTPPELAAVVSAITHQGKPQANPSENDDHSGRYAMNKKVNSCVGRMMVTLSDLQDRAASQGVSLEGELNASYANFTDKMCRLQSDDDKLQLLQGDQFPGNVLNTLQQTANVLKHIARSESELVSPQLRETAQQAVAQLLSGPIGRMAEPQIMELPE